MGFCPDANKNCPVVMNLVDLYEGKLSIDNVLPSVRDNISEVILEEITGIVAALVSRGVCAGPTKGGECVGELSGYFQNDSDFVNSTFCGLSTTREMLERVDHYYGINLDVRSPDS